jgi:hypothetical protein
MCCQEQFIPIEQANRCVIGSAHPSRALSNRIKNRLNIGWRAGDDAKDLAGRRLLFQRFLELLEQPDVLDRNDRLMGKRFQKLYLCNGEGTRFYPACVQCPNELPLLPKRCG